MLLAALFYPLTIALVAAGFLAFILLLIKVEMILVGSVVLWFYFVSILTVFLMSQKTLKIMGFYRIFLVMILSVGVLAILSVAVLLLKP